MIALAQLSESRIREATDSVFARAHFSRKPRWFDNLEIPLPDWPPRVWWTLLAVTLAMIAVSVLARYVPRGSHRGVRGSAGLSRGPFQDSWMLAHELAARGDHVGALHALFAALVSTLARAQQVDPHPAKTVGDYARELASRRSVVAEPFRDFAAQYERTLYGGSSPDRAAYESLVQLAEPIVSARGNR